MPEVLAIEQASFQEPWEEDDFLRELGKRSMIGIVAEEREAVIGFMVYELLKNHHNLTKLGVHPKYRRRGVGRALIEKLQSSRKRRRIVTVAHERNMPALLWLRALGFVAVGVDRQMFDDGSDGIRFEWTHASQVHQAD